MIFYARALPLFFLGWATRFDDTVFYMLNKNNLNATAQHKKSLRAKQAAEFLGIGRSTLFVWAKRRPDFPRPRKIGPKVTVWDLSELAAWRDAQQSK